MSDPLGCCSFPGCTFPAHRCQIDHLISWEDGGRTDQPNLEPLCRFHNRLKHRHAIRAQREPDGTITWTRPDGTPITVRWPHRLPRHQRRDGEDGDEGPAP